MRLIPEQFVVCWLALDDAGSRQRLPVGAAGRHHRGTAGTGATPPTPSGSATRATTIGVPVPAAKGSVVVLSSLLLHRSGPNTSDRHRRAWVLQFCPSGARSGLSGRTLDDRLVVAEDDEWLDAALRRAPLRPPTGARRLDRR